MIGFILAFLFTLILTPLVRHGAQALGLCDEPSCRRINTIPILTGGGIAIWGGIMGALVLAMPLTPSVQAIMLGGTAVFLLGCVDDFLELSPRIKLLGQIGAALLILPFGLQIQFVTNPWGGMIFLGIWGLPLTVLWVVGITNTVNFIDGLDGLAAGVVAIASVTLTVVAWQEGQMEAARLTLLVAGAALAFLLFNFHPARIIMGDSGAMLLGYFLATASILGALKSATAMTLLVPILALGVPITDTLLAIIRRRANGHPISLADKDHIHHRLLRAGFSHRGAVLTVYVISILLGTMAVLINTVGRVEGLMLLSLLFMTLALGAWRLGLFRLKEPQDQKVS